MTVRTSHIIAFVIVLLVLLGAAFSFGMKWSGKPESQSATVASIIEAEVATTTEEVSGTESERETYEVIKVVDGDTIAISINGKSETVRLIGIDTPETVDTRVEVQCFGKESSNKLKALLTGKRVYFKIDEGEGERDKYKRLLAYVFRDDGLFVNKYMIEEGYAYEYTYDTSYEHQKEFKAAETTAKAEKKGLWAPNACPKPEVKGATSKKAETAPATLPPPASSTPSTTPQQQLQQPQLPQPQQESEPEEEDEPDPPQTNGSYTCSANKYNCTDFTTHSEAQAVYDQCGGAGNDIHKLDSNKDGEACESLP